MCVSIPDPTYPWLDAALVYSVQQGHARVEIIVSGRINGLLVCITTSCIIHASPYTMSCEMRAPCVLRRVPMRIEYNSAPQIGVYLNIYVLTHITI